MRDSHSNAPLPPFSPAFIASFLLRPAPVILFDKLVVHILKKITLLYPEIFDRLKPLGFCRYCIIPTDLHLNFLVTLDHGKPSIETYRMDHSRPEAEATISGSLHSLIQLTEGNVDGDALFFSRALTVEGDTEAILSLRNAIDSADISLNAIWSDQGGSLHPIFQRILSKIPEYYRQANSDLGLIQRSIAANLPTQLHQLEADLETQERKIKKLEKEMKRLKASRKKNNVEMELG